MRIPTEGEDNAESDPRPPTEARQLYIRQSIEHVEEKYKEQKADRQLQDRPSLANTREKCIEETCGPSTSTLFTFLCRW